MVPVDSIPVCHSHWMSMTYFRPIQSCGRVCSVYRYPQWIYSYTTHNNITHITNNQLFNGTATTHQLPYINNQLLGFVALPVSPFMDGYTLFGLVSCVRLEEY